MITYVVIAILAVALVAIAFRRSYQAFATYRGTRVMACPETGQPVAIDLQARRAALAALFKRPDLRVQECSRWPERAGCDEACVHEIEAAPSAHRVPTILAEWCHSRPCVCCGAPLTGVHVGAHEPHLMNAGRKIVEWRQVPLQDLPLVLSTCAPVCETCLLAETHTW